MAYAMFLSSMLTSLQDFCGHFGNKISWLTFAPLYYHQTIIAVVYDYNILLFAFYSIV